MNSKMLIGGIIGGVAYFLLGYLIYGLLLADTMANYFTCQRPMAEINFILLFIGNLFGGWLIAFIFSKWAGIATFSAGLTAGAVLGLLMALSFDCTMFATSTLITDPMGIAIDVVISIVMTGIVGGLIGWWMGRK